MKRYRKDRTGETVPLAAKRPNHVWCMDLVFDNCLNGTNLKILAIKDEFTKECVALEVGTSFRTMRVQRVLADCIAKFGAPAHLRSDNGREFVSRSLTLFLSQSGINTLFIKPGSP